MKTIFTKLEAALAALCILFCLSVPGTAWAGYDNNSFGNGTDAGNYQEPPIIDGVIKLGMQDNCIGLPGLYKVVITTPTPN